jgi:hypothetical protein
MSTTIDLLRNQALWYAWGRADAGTAVDAFAFSEHYAALAARPGGRPSIQDAFRTFTTPASPDGVARCTCGCKYWRDGRCIDCGDSIEHADQG